MKAALLLALVVLGVFVSLTTHADVDVSGTGATCDQSNWANVDTDAPDQSGADTTAPSCTTHGV